LGERLEQYGIDPRSQVRRVLTFALDGKITLPPRAEPAPVPEDPGFTADATGWNAGRLVYDRHCLDCHGDSVIGTIHAPDLRRSAIPLSDDAFAKVVRDGAFLAHGMPNFPELSDKELRDLRQYIRTQAEKLRRRGISGN
jgi:quinohemoprotein ethanol dehydrogenase